MEDKWLGWGEEGARWGGQRAERRAVGMQKKEDETRFQKKEHDWVTNWIQMIKEIGDLNFLSENAKKNWLDGKVSHWERKSQVQLFVVTVMLRDSLREMLGTQLEIWDRVPFSLCDGDTMDRSKLRKWDAQRERSWGSSGENKAKAELLADGRRLPMERRCRIHPWEARAGRKEIRGRSEDWGWTSGFGEWSRKL